MSPLDRDRVLADLAPAWLDGLEGADRDEGARLLREIVDDWAGEADAGTDPDEVNRFQRDDLAAQAGGADAAGRLEALRAHVLRRRVDALDARALALGRAVIAGELDADEARVQGRAVLDEAEALAPLVRALPRSPAADAMTGSLGEAAMDALYAIERKAMSPRLARG